MAISQRNAATLIRLRKPFKAGNVYGERVNGIYAAYSYGAHFPIAVFCPEEGWLVNSNKYSPSTTIQMSKTEVRCLPGAQYRNTNELITRIRLGDAAHREAQQLKTVTHRLKEGLPA